MHPFSGGIISKDVKCCAIHKYKRIQNLLNINSNQYISIQSTLNIQNIQTCSTMKLLTGLLGCFLLICYLQEPSLAAPTHVKRDQELRNALFDVYGCRVVKAADGVRNKLNVS